MALVGSRSAFIYEFSACASRCSECGVRIPKGGPCLVSRKLVRRSPGVGKITKKVCSQECREEFEDRIWGEIINSKLAKKAERVFRNLVDSGMTCEAALRAMAPELREAKEALKEEP